jgi:hypothetical protein
VATPEQRTAGLVCGAGRRQEALSFIASTSMRTLWTASTFASAEPFVRLQPPSLLLVEFDLAPEGFWTFVGGLGRESPRPLLAVVGHASAEDAFRLATVGVAFLLGRRRGEGGTWPK